MQEDVGLQSRRPTASSGAPRGTWTSSTSSAASRSAGDKRSRSQFRNEEGDDRVRRPPRCTSTASSASRARSSATTSRFLRDDRHDGRPEADDPLAEHGALPRRRGRDRRGRLPRHRRVLDRPHRRLPRGGAPARRARLHLPPARRHQPRLPQRPARSATHVAAIGGDPEHQHVEYIRHINEALAGRPEGMARDDAHVPRQLPLLVGGRGRLRLRRRGAVQRARGRRLLPRVRRRALGRLRAAAASCRKGQAGRARPRDDEARRARERRTSSSAGSRRRPVRPLDQLCLSPQCGFSSTVEGNALTYEESRSRSCASSSRSAQEVWGG